MKAKEQEIRRRELEISQKEREFSQRLENEMIKYEIFLVFFSLITNGYFDNVFS